MAFLAGLAKGFSDRTVEKNDQKRKERLHEKELYFKNTIAPTIKDYNSRKAEIQSTNIELAETVNLLRDNGIPEHALVHVYNAGRNVDGKFHFQTAMDYYTKNRQYFVAPSPQDTSVSSDRGMASAGQAFGPPQQPSAMTDFNPEISDQRAQQQVANTDTFGGRLGRNLIDIFGNTSDPNRAERFAQYAQQGAQEFGVDEEEFRKFLAGQLAEQRIQDLVGPQGSFRSDVALSDKNAEKLQETGMNAALTGTDTHTFARLDKGIDKVMTNPLTGEHAKVDTASATSRPITERRTVTVPINEDGTETRTIETTVNAPSKEAKREALNSAGVAREAQKQAYAALHSLKKDVSLGNIVTDWQRQVAGIADNVGIKDMFPSSNERGKLNTQVLTLVEKAAELNNRSGRRSNQDVERYIKIITGDSYSGRQLKEVLNYVTESFEEAYVTSIFSGLDMYDDPEVAEEQLIAVGDQIAQDIIRDYNIPEDQHELAYRKAADMVMRYGPRSYGLK